MKSRTRIALASLATTLSLATCPAWAGVNLNAIAVNALIDNAIAANALTMNALIDNAIVANAIAVNGTDRDGKAPRLGNGVQMTIVDVELAQ